MAPPQQLLHYRIIAPLGSGAMGEVYRAVDEKLGREVALKLLPRDLLAERASHARLEREARAASALNHPGIVTLHDIEYDAGQSFIVMELVSGERFSDLAKRGLPWRRALELVASVGESLAFAHAREVLHRDIKSDNLMVTPSGQTKVLDFGLAKLRQDASASHSLPVLPENLEIAETTKSPTSSDLTQAGQLVGTPAYMAPECFEGKADARSDVFALGVVLYELLVGKRPFDRETATATMIAIQMDEPEPPSRLVPDLPERLDAIVAKAIAKQPDERYADMTAFVADLRAVLHVRARRWPWIAAALAAVIAASAITYAVIARKDDEPVEIAIGPSRRLTFDPSCEEYPRLHPDGKRVVYDGYVNNDYEVQIRDLDGGNKRSLTSEPGWDYAAAIAPDGKHVAYVHEHPLGRTLRVVDIDGGTPRDLGATAGYPSWTAAGTILTGDASGQILERSLDGKEIVRGRLPAGARLYHLVEVPGAGIALLWWTSSEADATALGELDTGGTLRVIEQGVVDYEGGLAPAHRRRGYYATRKAATEGNQLLFRAWGGGKPIVVGGGLSPGAGIDVARDGKRLVFSTCIERQYIARLDAGKLTVVSQGKWQDTNPRVVDDTHVIVTSDRTGTMQGWLLEIGGEARAITPPGALGASPSPDGKRVVYVTRQGLAIAPNNAEWPNLTSDPSDTSPVFTRDGTQIVFERTNARGESELYVVAVSGGEPRRLAPGAQPATSPVDDSIVFVSAADAAGARRVMRTTLAGAAPEPVPNLEPAAWQRPRYSPDGKRIVVVRGYQQIVTAQLGAVAPAVVELTATTGSVSTADFARDGTIIAALGDYDGDLWLAEGNFP